MLTLSHLLLGALSLVSLAQAVAFPQPSTTNGISAPSATFTFGNTGSTSTGMAIGVIVAIAVVIVCSVCGCCGMIWWFCMRHRKNMRALRAASAMTPVVPQEQAQQTAPLMNGQHSNVVPPTAYFDQAQQQQHGQQTGFYDAKMSLSTVTVMPMTAPGTPAPQYQQPHQTAGLPTVPPVPEQIHEMPSNPAPVAELKG